MRQELLDNLTYFAKAAAREAGRAILPHFRSALSVDNKLASQQSGWDPVTAGDRAAELAIRRMIEETYPSHGIIGEEFGVKEGQSDLTWVLDPIDGTRAFVIGLPTWAVLIGLYHRGKPLLGVMYQPFVDDLFVGNGSAAWLESRGTTTKLQVSATTSLAAALVGTTAPDPYKTDRDKTGLDTVKKSSRMLRFGGDAYFFALVAAGLLDVAMDSGLQVYDIAALIPIIEGAGGCVGTWDGKSPFQGGNIVAAANRELLAETTRCFSGSA